MTAGVWSQLRSAALIGAQRQPLQPIEVEGPTAQLVDHVDGTETGLLLAAGALTLARRSGVAAVGIEDAPAGAVPAARAVPSRPADAGPEERPLPPPAASKRLRALMAGGADLEHLTLWLELAQARGMRVPPRELPALFQLARVQHALRSPVSAVAGARGRWLAAHRSEWQWVIDARSSADDPDERLWHEGVLAERVAYLTALRRRDPDAGRDGLIDIWPTEPPAERAELLATLATGLSRADEEFFEAALDDRRKEVRAVAAELLADLPDSAYQARMIARSAAYVLPGRTIKIRPPVECDATMKRDGIDPKPPAGAGERAWWLEQVVVATPMHVWSRLGASPAEILRARVEPGWQQTLHRAWARAAVRTHDVGWAAALIDQGFGRRKDVEMHDMVLAASLYDVLPPEMAAERALRLLSASSAPDPTALSSVLDACPRPWPPALADALLAHLHRQLRAVAGAYVPPRLRTLAGTIVNGLALDAVPRVTALAEQIRSESQRGPFEEIPAVRLMDSLVIDISLRHTMFQEFA